MEKFKQVFLDSNIWIGLYNKDDSLHSKAKQIISELDNRKAQVIVTNFIVQETFTVLSKKMGQNSAVAFYEMISNNEYVLQMDIDKVFMQKIVDFIARKKFNKSLGFIDYSNLFLAHEFDLELVTFDETLLKVYQEML